MAGPAQRRKHDCRHTSRLVSQPIRRALSREGSAETEQRKKRRDVPAFWNSLPGSADRTHVHTTGAERDGACVRSV